MVSAAVVSSISGEEPVTVREAVRRLRLMASTSKYRQCAVAEPIDNEELHWSECTAHMNQFIESHEDHSVLHRDDEVCGAASQERSSETRKTEAVTPSAPDDSCCRMPTEPNREQSHRPKIQQSPWPLFACVARPVSKKEAENNPAAKAAMDKEWRRL